MKQADIKKGDLVLVTDGSYAVRVDGFEKSTSIGTCRDEFEIIGRAEDFLQNSRGVKIHDIFIKNTASGRIYLHSASCVEKAVKCECVCRCCKCCNK